MSLDNTRIIDAVGTEAATGCTVLTITDHWDWEDEHAHLLALQEKLNSYFEFVESGQLAETRPDASKGQVRINVVSRFPMPSVGKDLISKASDVARQIDIEVTTEHYAGSSPL